MALGVLGRPGGGLFELSDKLLVARAKGGDAEAFGVLVDRYWGRVFEFVLWRVFRDEVLAEDLTADTFLRAWEKLDLLSLDGPGFSFGGWVTTIARNRVANFFRSGLFKYMVPVGSPHVVGRMGEGEDSSAWEWHDPVVEAACVGVLRRWRVSVLRPLLQSLTVLQLACVVLRFWDGLSVPETAERLGLGEQAVKSATHRALTRLRAVVPAALRESL